MISIHEGSKPFVCLTCGLRFPFKVNLKQHIEAVHEKKRPFKYIACETTFAFKHNVKKHIDGLC